jgi:hypothetical protein
MKRMDENCCGLRFSLRGFLACFVALAVVFAAVAALHRAAIREKGPTRPFEAESWKAAYSVGNGRNVRSEMVEDLLDKYDFTGWSRAEVHCQGDS